MSIKTAFNTTSKNNSFGYVQAQEPSSQSYLWQRPSDWLTLPTVNSTDNKIVILMAILSSGSNYCAFTISGNYTVDWGDGTSAQNYSAGTKAQYLYDYSTISSTITSEGYKQVIITITPQGAATFTSVDFQQKHSDISGSGTCLTTYLDMTVGMSGSTLQLSNYSTTVTSYTLLKKFTLANFSTSGGLGSTLFRGGADNVAHMIFSKPGMFISSSGPFQYAASLQKIDVDSSLVVQDCSNLFLNCYNLINAPMFNTSTASNFSSMFQGCSSLQTVPLYNTSSGTNFTSMFNACSSLQSVPFFNTASATVMSAMFNACSSLKVVPKFNTATVTSMNTMFNGCAALKSVPLFNTALVQSMNGMFNGCAALKSVPLFNCAALTNTGSMFSSCSSLETIPEMFTGSTSINTVSSMFTGCTVLKKTPAITIQTAPGSPTNPFANCNSLMEIGLWNVSNYGSNTTTISSWKLRRSQIYGGKFTMSYLNQDLPLIGINEVITNLGSGATTQTLTITGNPGANLNPVISKTGSVTQYSKTVTMSDTSSLVVGQQVTSTNLSPVRTTIGLTQSSSVISYGAMQPDNGTLVSFSSITNITGITAYTPYYVINANSTNFQISTTQGGSAITFGGTDGTATVYVMPTITSITTNTSITVSVGALATNASESISARNINTQLAVLKNWTVTG